MNKQELKDRYNTQVVKNEGRIALLKKEQNMLYNRSKQINYEIQKIYMDNEAALNDYMQGLQDLKKSEPAKVENSVWHSADEIPNEGRYYIVRTSNGSTLVSSPVEGKWLPQIVSWMEIPE